MLFVCNPRKNTQCKKTGCYEKTEFPCFATLNPEWADYVIHPLDEMGCHTCQYGAYFNASGEWKCSKTTRESCKEKSMWEPVKEVKNESVDD